MTHKVDSHYSPFAQHYQCMLIKNLQNDSSFHIDIDWNRRRIIDANLMPTDDLILDCAETLLKLSPTFKEKFERLALEYLWR